MNKEVIARLSKSLSKTDVIRMALHCPEYMNNKQRAVLDRYRIENRIYNSAVSEIDIPIITLTSLLNLGRITLSAKQRIKEKIDGRRAYSRLDLVVIQLIRMMVLNGIDVTKISHDKRLKTTLNGKASKTELITKIRRGEVLPSDEQNVAQYEYQASYYSSRLLKLNMAIWDLTYFLNLGAVEKSDYNKIRDKLRGVRPYSILDLVIARLLEVALDHRLHPYYITYNSEGEVIEPQNFASCLQEDI